MGRERERNKGVEGGHREASKGYLHRVVFFLCFLFERFTERINRLIFGMMSMNYILYIKPVSILSPAVRICFRGMPRGTVPSRASIVLRNSHPLSNVRDYAATRDSVLLHFYL